MRRRRFADGRLKRARTGLIKRYGHFVLDLTATGSELKAQIERFGKEVRPLLSF